MTNPILLDNSQEIEDFLRQNSRLHIYEIGDLDDFFRPHTIWYGLKQDEAIIHLALLYTASSPPTLLSLTDRNPTGLSNWFQALFPMLPNRVHTHLSPGIPRFFREHFHQSFSTPMHKMALSDPGRGSMIDTSRVIPLKPSDLPDLLELYETSYPENSFDPRMLETGCFFGERRSGKLVGVAGIHVYSSDYKVSALGNVTTHPDYRRQGIAASTCAALCKHLLEKVDHIGLNVKQDNTAAVDLYERLGFTILAPYQESLFHKK